MAGIRSVEPTVTAVPDSAVAAAEAGGAASARAETIARLRRRIAAVPSSTGERREPSPVPPPHGRTRAREAGPAQPLVGLPGLEGVLPSGGIARGEVTAVTGARALLVGLLAEATGSGRYAAVVGQPDLGVLAAAEMGAELDRIALVPDPGPDPVGIAAVLADGMDLVMVDLAGARVPPSRSRAVMARLRSRGAALVVTGGEWEGAHVRLDARVGGYEGLGAGRGRVRGMSVDVRARGRAGLGGASRGTRLLLRRQHGGMRWSAVEAAPVAESLGPVGEERRGA